MKRRLFTILSALSLLLFVAVCVVWVRSHIVSDRISDYSWIGSSNIRTEVQSGSGAVGVQVCIHSLAPEQANEIRTRMEANPLALAVQHRKPWPQPPNFGLIEGGTYVSTGPFQIAWFGHGTVSGPGVRIVLPYWVLAAAAFLLMAPWGWDRLRRRWRLRSGTCTSCGYDLRATPDRCPECGAVPAKAGR